MVGYNAFCAQLLWGFWLCIHPFHSCYVFDSWKTILRVIYVFLVVLFSEVFAVLHLCLYPSIVRSASLLEYPLLINAFLFCGFLSLVPSFVVENLNTLLSSDFIRHVLVWVFTVAMEIYLYIFVWFFGVYRRIYLLSSIFKFLCKNGVVFVFWMLSFSTELFSKSSFSFSTFFNASVTTYISSKSLHVSWYYPVLCYGLAEHREHRS